MAVLATAMLSAGAARGSAAVPGQATWQAPVLAYRPGPSDSVLVLGAHPDDVALGGGAFAHEAVAAGARVTLVTFTNGDAFITGVDLMFHTLAGTPALFVKYGALRQQEELAAARALGVRRSGQIFLEYPDRGLETLWDMDWTCDHLYTSPYTGRDHSPYHLGLHPLTPYCGANVLADVESILREVRPTVVVMHHPADAHPDHWASEAFVTTALESLALAGDDWARRVRVFHYMVHRGTWPVPRAYAPELPLRPPADLQLGNVDWVAVPLSPESEDAQRDAILNHHSQIELMRAYMMSFVRRPGLFDVAGDVRAAQVDDGRLAWGAEGRWDALPPAVVMIPPSVAAQGGGETACAGCTITTSAPVGLTGGLDTVHVLQAVAVARSRSSLYLDIRLRRPPAPADAFRIELRLFHPGGTWNRLVLDVRSPGRLDAVRRWPQDLALPAGAVARSVGSRLEVALPLAELGDPASVYVEVARGGPLPVVIEHTPWTMVRLTDIAARYGS